MCVLDMLHTAKTCNINISRIDIPQDMLPRAIKFGIIHRGAPIGENSQGVMHI